MSFSIFFFFSSRRRHTRLQGDWSSDVCSSDLLSGASRELAEGVFQLVTAALLLYASHWLLAALSAKRLVSFVSTRTMAAGSAAVILGLSFMVVYREMFEAVLFFPRLLLEGARAGG